MPLPNISHTQLQDIVAQLDQALYNHKEWHRSLIRTLVCQLPSDQHDLSQEAYKECRFGQWYYTYADKNVRETPGFVAIGKEHKRLHKLTAQLLTASYAGHPIPAYDYDNFTNSLERLQLEIYALKRELEELMYHRDTLTGAIGRVDMLPMLREQVALVKHHLYKQGCIVMMDLDHFREINDTYGHAAGDTVLTVIVHYITEKLRSYDKIFRYGGEEFLLLLANVEIATAYTMIDRLREGIAHLSIDIGNNNSIHLTASFGLTVLNPNITVEQSVEQADKALYAAKAAGRNCIKTLDQL